MYNIHEMRATWSWSMEYDGREQTNHAKDFIKKLETKTTLKPKLETSLFLSRRLPILKSGGCVSLDTLIKINVAGKERAPLLVAKRKWFDKKDRP